jgi:hypothetical protein
MATKKTPANKPAPKKTTCPISRKDFRAKAKPLSIVIDGQNVGADVKEFSTGSFGWFLNGKVTVLVDGVPVKVQVGLNLTVVGSKELPADEAAAA